MINVANPAAPVEVGAYDTPGWAAGVAVAGNFAYVADGDRGLRVINVANPAAPVEVGFCDTPGVAMDVAVARNYAYVADEACRAVGDQRGGPGRAGQGRLLRHVGDGHRCGCGGRLSPTLPSWTDGLRVINVANPACAGGGRVSMTRQDGPRAWPWRGTSPTSPMAPSGCG